MHSMRQEDALVVGGVDAHADAHYAAALDERGALLSTKSFPTTTAGYRELLEWLSGFGELDVVAVESTGSYAAALVRVEKPQVVARPRRALLVRGAASPLSDCHSERSPGFRRRLCATASVHSDRLGDFGPGASFAAQAMVLLSAQARSRGSRLASCPRYPTQVDQCGASSPKK